MEVLSRDDVRTLAQYQRTPCVSAYLPTHRAGDATQQDRIRLKNLLGQAEEHLIAIGMRSPEARQLLAPAQRLLEDSPFWAHQRDGLAVFVGPDLFRYFRLPLRFDELVVANARFHLKPLLPAITGDGRFFVLALSQKELRLLHGARNTVAVVDVPNLPKSLADALKYDEFEKQMQFHTRAPDYGGKRGAMFHGHGAGVDDEKDRLLRYFRRINAGLQEFLHDEQTPLVLAGVEYYFPIYAEANTYNHLVEHGIHGNPEILRPDELQKQAWNIVEPIFQKAQQEGAAAYRQAAGTGRASQELSEVLPAAHDGRVGTLFVVRGRQIWGTFDPEKRAVEAHAERQPADLDLLDVAAIATFLNGGTVYAVPPGDMPAGNNAAVAAHYRY